MREDTKKSAIWTGATVAAFIVIVGAMWAFGVFEPTAIQ